jgi:septal ring factor EnvC (AmiA/AmiB activator)
MEDIPYSRLKRLYKAVCDANNDLQSKLTALQRQLGLLVAEREQWERAKTKQQTILQQTLDGHNTKMSSILNENQRLKDELRKLRNGD